MKMILEWENTYRGSSPVDWCEENYTFSPYIAEFVNTFSNFLFFLLPPLLIYLHHPYSQHCGKGIHVIWILLIVVGVCSAYFHATLSLLGQLLDEISILWVIMAAFSMWFPKMAFPFQWGKLEDGRKRFSYLCLSVAIISTLLGFLQPVVNAFILLTFGIPGVWVMVHELRLERNPRILSLGRRCITMWILAIICWFNDRIFCSWWASVGFPYLHGAWHILIFLASYTAAVLFAYFDVRNNRNWDVPQLRYFPSDKFELGVPFVQVKSY